LSGYARIDLRLDDAGNVWVLEANPNPQIAKRRRLRRVSRENRPGLRSRAASGSSIWGVRWQPESVGVTWLMADGLPPKLAIASGRGLACRSLP